MSACLTRSCLFCLTRTCLSAWPKPVCLHDQNLSFCMTRTCLSAWSKHVCLHDQNLSVCMTRTCLSARPKPVWLTDQNLSVCLTYDFVTSMDFFPVRVTKSCARQTGWFWLAKQKREDYAPLFKLNRIVILTLAMSLKEFVEHRFSITPQCPVIAVSTASALRRNVLWLLWAPLMFYAAMSCDCCEHRFSFTLLCPVIVVSTASALSRNVLWLLWAPLQL